MKEKNVVIYIYYWYTVHKVPKNVMIICIDLNIQNNCLCIICNTLDIENINSNSNTQNSNTLQYALCKYLHNV